VTDYARSGKSEGEKSETAKPSEATAGEAKAEPTTEAKSETKTESKSTSKGPPQGKGKAAA
jgi:hypothetical protein